MKHMIKSLIHSLRSDRRLRRFSGKKIQVANTYSSRRTLSFYNIFSYRFIIIKLSLYYI